MNLIKMYNIQEEIKKYSKNLHTLHAGGKLAKIPWNHNSFVFDPGGVQKSNDNNYKLLRMTTAEQ